MADSDSEEEGPDDRRRRLANARQKKYYQKNKVEMTASFQKQRDDLKVCEHRKLKRARRLLRGRVIEIEPPIEP
jgi:hypothetical protein